MQNMKLHVEQRAGRLRRSLRALSVAALLTSAGYAQSALDLRNATVERLDNGLTVILLEDRHFPVASVQMLYRVGARDEVSGKTGLAHFLEHMAFRDSRNFPDTELVSRVYAVGGEWHGYTWIDQTTYFATVPGDQLDLLLRIEADRMSRLLIEEDDMAAERGAVLAEMHMYENSPSSMLIDAALYVSFLAHPYRNNTIGWESDIENLQHSDVAKFYEQHYQPANAVIAVVGDFDSKAVLTRIDELFGSVPRAPATPLPHTIEPMQTGERRVVVDGNAPRRQFVIAYRAPSVNSPDFATFLVLQELLGAGSGVNFLQNDWGTPVDDESALYGAAEELTTWYPPSAQNYVFLIGGYAADDTREQHVEQEIERRVAAIRRIPPEKPLLAAAIDDVLDALAFDVETTEDAAHQLAFFDGLRALDTLIGLPESVAAVTAADVQRVAQAYLDSSRRTIAWYLPAARAPLVDIPALTATTAPGGALPPPRRDDEPLRVPTKATLSGGIPVLVQPSKLSSSVQLQVLLASNQLANLSGNDPVLGHSSLTYKVRPTEFGTALARARDRLRALRAESVADRQFSSDPATRLRQEFETVMDAGRAATAPLASPELIVVSGDVDVAEVLVLLEQSFGGMRFEQPLLPPVPLTARRAAADMDVNIGTPIAQAQLGYIVQAPGPAERASDAYRLLLYILSHGYEGRLGKKAISERGLAYYIESRYESDGTTGWVTLATGVDPPKIEAFRELLDAELQRLQTDPPTDAEIDEAKQHMIGRLQSGAQSNAELAAQLARQWIWYGETVTVESLRGRLNRISRRDVLDIVPAFVSGATIVVAE